MEIYLNIRRTDGISLVFVEGYERRVIPGTEVVRARHVFVLILNYC